MAGGFPPVIDLDTLEVYEEYSGMYCKQCQNALELDEPVCLFCDTEYPDSFWTVWKDETAGDARPIILPVEWPYEISAAYDIMDQNGLNCENCNQWCTDGCAPLLGFLLDIQVNGTAAESRPYSLRACGDYDDS